MSASFGRVSRLRPAPDWLTFCWLVGSMALAVLPHLPRLPLWMPLLFLLAVMERASHFRWKRRPLPSWLRLVLTLLCIAGVWSSYGTILGRQAGVALLCTMLALKLSETFRSRDVFLLISLAYFIVITQFLFDQSIYLAVYLLAVAVIITATLIVNEAQPARDVRTPVRDWHGAPDVLRRAGWMLLQGLPLMLALFALFPRLGTPLWGVPEDALYGKTGISDHMEPGSIRDLFIDDSPAFRVDFAGDARPSQGRLYWRGPVLWHFDGAAWCREAPCIQDDGKDPQPRRIGKILGEVDQPLRYSVTLEPTQQLWLFALDTPVSPPRGFMGLEVDYTLHRTRPVTRTFQYDMTSDTGYQKNTRTDGRLTDRGLQLPNDRNPRTRALAEDLRAQFGEDSRALVTHVLQTFRQENYRYSFTPPPLGFHTVDDFLFETREGYCEYYSSAFTFLMRAAGIPARVVTGYQGGEYMGDPEYLLVRQSDAHAWSEVWLEGEGWVRVDPTAAVAPERVDRGALAALAGQRRGVWDYPWVRELRNQLDTVHRVWTDWVLKFDQARQKALLQPVGIDELSSSTAILLLTGIIITVTTVVMWLLLRVQWIGGLDPASRAYARFCRKLSRRGLPRSAAEGPEDFAERAAAVYGEVAEDIRRITRLYIQQRYARTGDDASLTLLRRAVRSFRVRGRRSSSAA
ncbi:MAG: DUF3488 and transglutaminase-like domain-containing protein [Pseudomonadota bacterium]